MDFRQYQYVLKIAELKNMTKAAGELYITQPSLSHYIAKIEEELGTQLFNRLTTPISLTPAGEKYVETARLILQLNAGMKREIQDLASGKKGVITVGISHARASFFLPYILPEFRAQYPGMEVKTVEIKSSLIEEYVQKGQCDLGIMPLPVINAGLQTTVICKEELVLVSGRPLPFGKATPQGRWIALADCGGHEFVLLKKGHGIRTAIDVLMMEAGIKPDQIFETTSNETAYRMATAGMGLSIVPESTIFLSRPMENPHLYSLSAGKVCWEIGAVFCNKDGLTEAQKAFLGLLQARFSHRMNLHKGS